MGISNIIVGFFSAAYGAYVMNTENSVAGFVLMLLGLVDFTAGVMIRCK